MLRSLQNKLIRLLRLSEKYTKTDMVFLASRSSFSLLAQIITSIATLAFAVVVGHMLPKETYGEYKYVLSIISLLSFFSLNSIGGAVFQSTAQGHDGALRRGFWGNIRWSFVVFAGALAVALYYFALNNTQLAVEILLGGCLSPFVASANLYSPFLAGKKAFIRQMSYSIIDNLFTTGIMIATVLLTSNAFVLVAAYFISNLLGALFLYRRTEAIYKANEGTHDETMLNFAKHLSVLGVLGGIVDTLDQILVFHFAGAAQLAVFAFATALPDQIKTPFKTLDTMVQAGFADRSDREIDQRIRHKIFWYFVSIALIVVAYILLAPIIFGIFFPKYHDSVGYSQIYIFWLFGMAFDPVQSYFASRKMVQELYFGGIFFITCQATLMIIGILWLGILGLILAQVITRILSALLNFVLYLRASKNEQPT